jgi:hypothetical protein
MHTGARVRGATVAVIAALLLVTAWIAVGDRSLPQVVAATGTTHTEAPDRSVSETLTPVDATHAVVASIPDGSRLAQPRLAPVWALAALAATMAALGAHRRRQDIPGRVARPRVWRGSVARRAPPLASLA